MAHPVLWRPRNAPTDFSSDSQGGAAVSDAGTGMPTSDEEHAMAKSCGCSVSQLRHLSASAIRYMTAELRSGSGSGNQGYAQCVVDRLFLEVEKGACSPARIQCRQEAVVMAAGLGPQAIATHIIKPVGLSVAREFIVHAILNDAPVPLDTFAVFRATITQMEALGRTAFSGTQTGVGAAIPLVGTPLATYLPEKMNYVLPSGIAFESSNELNISITNNSPLVGGDAISYSATLTYDVIRWG